MKRYALFGGRDYYPHGGWGDFIDSYDTVEAAEAFLSKMNRTVDSVDWWEIVDLQECKVVKESD